MIKILLAEDTPEWQKAHISFLNLYIGADKYEICAEKNAKDALEKAKEEKFDLIITDLQMELDFEHDFAGEWLVKQIKETEKNAKTPVIIVSATYNIGFIAEKLGVRYLSKRTMLSMPDSYSYTLREVLSGLD